MIKKNKLYIFIFFILSIFFVLILFDAPCIFKLLFNMPCPGCGLTRAFKQILKFNFAKAMYYNILSIPLLVFFIWWIILFIKDIINKENKSLDTIINFFSKYYIIIIILLIISEIVNIIHGI